MNDADQPLKQRMKIVQLLDCIPGNQDHPKGPPITIITVGCGGEIEEPLMVSIRDTETLLLKLLVSLATHGDDFAEKLLEEYFTDHDKMRERPEEERCPAIPSPESPVHSKPRHPKKLTDGKASFVKFAVQYGTTYRPRNTLSVISGYSDGKSTYILYRMMGRKIIDGIVKLLPEHVILRDEDDADRILPDDWPRFVALADGAIFMLNKKTWTKLSIAELCPLVGGRTFREYIK